MLKHSTVAAIVQDHDAMLLCLRTDERAWFPGRWELPGGHILDGESPRDGLRRELSEELGIVPVLENAAWKVLHTSDIEVSIWQVTSWEGEVRNSAPAEHSEIRWVSLHEAVELSLGPLAARLLGGRVASHALKVGGESCTGFP